MDLAALGIKAEDLIDRIVENVGESLLSSDEHNDPYAGMLRKRVDEKVKEAINVVVDRVGTETIAPKVVELIEGMTFQKTNGYGEPKSPAKTWREMLVERAENWMIEEVDFNGKTRAEDSYNWRRNTTRIAYMVEKHIQFEIDKSVKAALADLNSKVAGGVAHAVKISLAETLAKLKIETKV